jgi:hypothetical protein
MHNALAGFFGVYDKLAGYGLIARFHHAEAPASGGERRVKTRAEGHDFVVA